LLPLDSPGRASLLGAATRLQNLSDPLSKAQRLLRLPFKQQTTRLDPDELRRRLIQLRAEVLDLEQRPGEPPLSDLDVLTPNLVVQRLRAPLLQADLAGKRKQLALLAYQAAALGIDVADLDGTLADAPNRLPAMDPPSEASQASDAGGSWKRLARLATIAAVPLVLLGLGIAAPDLVGSGWGSGPTAGGGTGLVAAERIEVSPYIASSAVEYPGATFFTREVEFTFNGGQVIVSGDPPPGGAFSVDDGMQMSVTHPDGSVVTWRRDFNRGCVSNIPALAEDVTNLFQPGLNRVTVTLYDTCGGLKGTTSPIWLESQ
jgi:hypothetical protein